MKLIHAGLCLCLGLFASAQAADEPDRKPWEEMLPLWTKAWNDADLTAIVSLCHPEEKKLRGKYENAPDKEKIKKAFKQLFDEFGKITSASLGKFIAEKDRFVVKITYEKKGLVPGTMALKKDRDGSWKISDFNIDGQGEPELKQ